MTLLGSAALLKGSRGGGAEGVAPAQGKFTSRVKGTDAGLSIS